MVGRLSAPTDSHALIPVTLRATFYRQRDCAGESWGCGVAEITLGCPKCSHGNLYEKGGGRGSLTQEGPSDPGKESCSQVSRRLQGLRRASQGLVP